MRKVNDILKRKGNMVSTISSNLTVIEALEQMATLNIGSLVVLDNDTFIGIFTERDYSRKVILKGRHSSNTLVGEIMTTDFPSVQLKDSVEKCMQLMSLHHVRYIPVIEQGKLVGIISINDVVTETINNQLETISQLQHYIQS
ncbi:MAG: CBS domain-containing protein [Bacteroidetes bacterium]|nr:CBS domain-containing protein [Bacteroidota bacterium]